MLRSSKLWSAADEGSSVASWESPYGPLDGEGLEPRQLEKVVSVCFLTITFRWRIQTIWLETLLATCTMFPTLWSNAMVVLLGPTVLVVLSSHMAKYILLSIQRSMKCCFVKNLKIKHLFFNKFHCWNWNPNPAPQSAMFATFYIKKDWVPDSSIYLSGHVRQSFVLLRSLSAGNQPLKG